MDPMFKRQHPVLDSLAELGARGHYPLFESMPEWGQEALAGQRPLNKKERLKARELFKRIEGQRTLERQRAVIHDLIEDDRTLLIRAFVKLVEGKIIDARPQLQ